MEQLTLEQAAEKHSTHQKSPVGSVLYIHKTNSFKAGAEWQKEQSQWINVNDRIPSFLRYVLVYNTEGATLIARRFENGWWALFSDGEHRMGELAPTHWQPLPEPPVKLLQD